MEYMDNPDVRKKLGVDDRVGNFTSCSNAVGQLFAASNDILRSPTSFYLEGLLERDVRVLIYVGSADWICNWVSSFAPLRPWIGTEGFLTGRQ